MKRISIALLLLIGFIGSVAAQERKWEHSVNISAGQFQDGTLVSYDTGLSLKFGYGLAYRFAEQFSVKTGIAMRRDIESAFQQWEGGDYDTFEFIEVPSLPATTPRIMSCLALAPCLRSARAMTPIILMPTRRVRSMASQRSRVST